MHIYNSVAYHKLIVKLATHLTKASGKGDMFLKTLSTIKKSCVGRSKGKNVLYFLIMHGQGMKSALIK